MEGVVVGEVGQFSDRRSCGTCLAHPQSQVVAPSKAPLRRATERVLGLLARL